jgi:intracellular sulfur oxidation DsrE/DsrF family protein
MTAFGTAFAASGSTARAQPASPGSARWQPERHAEDDWLDQIPGAHRFFFDTVTAAGFGEAIRFSNTYFNANKNGYGLEDGSLAVVICARHHSTAFAYTDAMWAKYGAPLAERARFSDPKTGKPPIVNVYQASGYETLLGNNGITLDSMVKRGVHLAVCRLATRACAATIARQTGGKPDEIYQELVSNLVANAHIVPAGIVAVDRAQERGYAFAYTG